MSFLEVRDRGLPYGGIPYQELLNKLEETDMNETLEDVENNYNNYIRSEIIDRNQDTPFLESDNKRNSSVSKSIINLRYNGSRGEYESPQHPELFMGFMDQDTRALDNNPRMDQYQKQINTRMPNLEVSMGHNSMDTDHESPWTNQSLGQCRRDIQTSLAYNTKIFTDERDGRALNRNFVVNYDHNKKPLIYKDVVPSGINGITENIQGKANTQYTTSAVPFVSNDTLFKPSYNNNTVLLMPGLKSCQKYKVHDQVNQEELTNKNGQGYVLGQESKMKTSNVDQIHNEHYDNYNVKVMPGIKYNAKNITAEVNDTNLENNKYAKNTIVNTITNPTLLSNDPVFYESTDTNSKKTDYMKHGNATTFINSELQPNTFKVNEIQKSIPINTNNLTFDSSYNVPVYIFRHTEIARHATPDNKTVINKVIYDTTYGQQAETYIKSTKYKFTDNAMIYSIATVPDTTTETQLRNIGNYKQEHKLQNTNAEEVWATSDENSSGKTQKQSRTGGQEPIVMDIQDSHDFETGNGGSIIGKKSVRGDIYNQGFNSSHINDMYDSD